MARITIAIGALAVAIAAGTLIASAATVFAASSDQATAFPPLHFVHVHASTHRGINAGVEFGDDAGWRRCEAIMLTRKEDAKFPAAAPGWKKNRMQAGGFFRAARWNGHGHEQVSRFYFNAHMPARSVAAIQIRARCSTAIKTSHVVSINLTL